MEILKYLKITLTVQYHKYCKFLYTNKDVCLKVALLFFKVTLQTSTFFECQARPQDLQLSSRHSCFCNTEHDQHIHLKCLQMRRGSGRFKQGQRRHFYIPVLSCFVQSGYHWFVQLELQLTCTKQELLWFWIGLVWMPRLWKIGLVLAVCALYEEAWPLFISYLLNSGYICALSWLHSGSVNEFAGFLLLSVGFVMHCFGCSRQHLCHGIVRLFVTCV